MAHRQFTFGLGLRAIRENEQKAKYLGVNVQRYPLVAFVIAGVYGAVGGVIVAIPVGLADPSLAYRVQSGNLVFMLLLGGYTNFFGPVLGAVLFIFFQDQLMSLHRILAAHIRCAASGHRDLFSERADGNRRSAALVVDMTLLQASDVKKFYGVFCALNGVSLSIGEGEHVSIIGPDGAGKTTLVNVLTGLIPPSTGALSFKGHDVGHTGVLRLSRLGMARSFQLMKIFPLLPLRESIAVAAISNLVQGGRIFAGLRANNRCGTSSARGRSLWLYR